MKNLPVLLTSISIISISLLANVKIATCGKAEEAKRIHQEAIQLYKQKKYKEAIEKFKEAEKLMPNPVSLFNIGKCYEKLGNFPHAYKYYKKYLSSGDRTMAKKAKSSIEFIEEISKEILHTAIGNYKKEKYDEALSGFLKSQEMVPRAENNYYIASCYHKLYQFELAYKYYKKYLDTNNKTFAKTAKQAIKEIESQKVILKVITIPEGADVYVDDEKTSMGATPLIKEVEAGEHTVVIRKKGFEDTIRHLKIPFGGEAKLEVTLRPVPIEVAGKSSSSGTTPEAQPIKTRAKIAFPVTVGVAGGVTISTTEEFGSYIIGNISAHYRIKKLQVGTISAGLGIDNLFFTDSFMFIGYPAVFYTLKIWRNLFAEFAMGFGGGYFHVFKENLSVSKGGHWDIILHAEGKLLYKLGAFLIKFHPLHLDFITGAGNIKPAPLAQFCLLIGVAYEH